MPRHAKRQVQIYRAVPTIAIGGLDQSDSESERTIEVIRVRLFPARSEILLFVDLQTTRVVLEARTFRSAQLRIHNGVRVSARITASTVRLDEHRAVYLSLAQSAPNGTGDELLLDRSKAWEF